MDVDVSHWVLKLLLRCLEVGDGVAKLLFSFLPLPNGDPFLLKSVALRSICAKIDEASISEKLLDFIEVVEVIDRNVGLRISELMKEAYCAVAVECSVRYIHGGRMEKQGKFAEAVSRIWTGRIRAIEKLAHRTELVTLKLLEWGRRIEVAVGNQSECLNLMGINSRAIAFSAVRVYVTDAMDKMRPSFLEAVAVRLGLGVHCSTHEDSRMHDDGTKSAWQAGARVNGREESTPSAPAKCTETNDTEDPRSAREPSETHESLGSNRLPCYKRKRDGSVIRDTEESRSETLWTEYDTVSSPEVNDATKSSSSKLKVMVGDPLSDALQAAGSFAPVSVEHSLQDPARKVYDTQDANSNIQANPLVVETSCPDKDSNHRKDIRTNKQEDSINNSREETKGDAGRPMLSSRRRGVIWTPQAPELGLRRKKKMRSNEEEDALRIGVRRFGKGNWKLILSSYNSVLVERTKVDLKDKWRNMTRY